MQHTLTRLGGLIACVLVAFSPSSLGQGIQPAVRHFYVGQYGGSFSQSWEQNSALLPFQTLQKALEEVRDFISISPSHGEVYVHVAGGEYFLDQPLVFTAADSGTASYPIHWVAWNGAGHQTPDDDVLILGGVRLDDAHLDGDWEVDESVDIDGGQAWKIALSDYTGTATLTAPRDLWYDGRRMIRARFPNPPESEGTGLWPAGWPATMVTAPNSITPPYANEGFLVVTSMGATQDDEQRIVIENGPGRTYEVEEIESWVGVEVSAFNGYVAPRQIIDANDAVLQEGETNPDLFRKVTIWFDITQLNIPNTDPVIKQDVGGLGPFDLDHDAGYSSGYLEVWKSAQPSRGAQIVLENHFKFLDRVGEWYCGAQNLWIALPCDVDPNPHNGSPGVIFPILDKILVLDGTKYVDFTGIDFAYTDMPFPKQGWPGWTEPGYTTIQSGWNWQEANKKYDVTNALPASVELKGAKNIGFESCRFGHFGGSGVSIGERVIVVGTDAEYYSSNDNTFDKCEVLDVGGHGIYIGDRRTQQGDHAWDTGDHEDYPEPHAGNTIMQSYIHRFAVTYKDGAGLLIEHTRDTTVIDNKIELGNWSGIAVGGINRYRYTGPNLNTEECELAGTANWPQANEDLIIRRNSIHKACLRLNDGAGISSRTTWSRCRWSRLVLNLVPRNR